MTRSCSQEDGEADQCLWHILQVLTTTDGQKFEGQFLDGYVAFAGGEEGPTVKRCTEACEQRGMEQIELNCLLARLPDGQLTWTDTRAGTKYVGEWYQGVKKGQGIMHWASGETFVGTFENDRY
jgi:hypothetical protein